MPQIIKQLMNSEKFVYVSTLYMFPLTIFCFMGKVSITEWNESALWAVGILVGGKSIQGAAAALSGSAAKRK